MTRTRRAPIRTCVGCGLTGDKRSLVRLVRSVDGHIELDPTGKARGRGAYVCSGTECFERAIARKRLNTALRVNLHEDDLDRLRRDLESLHATAAAPGQGR
ncbi:MAG TPA: YlxR family protein [Coriobacteriia bacterium]|nr:YlxR family protein [Coriobacteriia bacterium]